MKKFIPLFLFALVAMTTQSFAVEASTDPVGFVSVSVQPNSDAVLAVPLYRAAAFRGVIQSISGSVITVSGTPGWTASQFVKNSPSQNETYAVLLASGTKEGLIAKVSANGTNTLTITLDSGDDLTGVKTEAVNPGAADQIDIMPYWTPNSLFGGSTIPANTELYAFDNNTAGQNVSPSSLLQYFDGFGWYETVGFTDQSYRPMAFGAGFIVRNSTASVTNISFVGAVPMSEHRLKLKTLASNVPQDQTIGYTSPVPEPLKDLGLGAENYDELYVYDNSVAGLNKSPSLLLLYFNGRWYNSSNFADVNDTVIIQPGSAMIYRKAATTTPQNFVWADLQTYLSSNP